MSNRFFVLIFLLTTIAFAQVPEKVHQKTSKFLSFDSEVMAPATYGKYTPVPSVFKVQNPANGDTVGYTSFDYFANSLVRDQVAFYDGKVHISPMIRKWGSTKRTVSYITNNNATSTYTTVQAFDSVTGASGYQQIDIQRTGTAPGTIGIVAHQTVSGATQCRLGIWDGTSAFLPSTFAPATDPSLQFVGDTIFLSTSGNRLEFSFFKSPDYGTTINQFAHIGDFSSTFFWKNNGTTELGIAKSRNEQYVAYYGGSRYSTSGTPAYNADSPDTVDNMWYILSSDKGKTFVPFRTGISGVIGLVPSRPLYAPLLCNFAQTDLAITNTGVIHQVFNGYSAVFNATKDTILADAFPMLYWNSVNKTFITISDINVDTLVDLDNIDRPGNNLGASYPSIAVSDDGKGVFAIWTGPQITGGAVDSVNGGGFYWTDLYYAYSADGGNKWTYGGTVPGANQKQVAEQYGTCAQFLEDNGTTWRAHVLYEADLINGISVFTGGNAISNNPLVYKTIDFPKTPAGIKDIANGKKNFSLDQNFPNPFNPSTSINFSLAARSAVTLKVYDMLGREVATLVNNEEIAAGSHSVSFDASKLTSGVYIYSLKAGNFSESKKLTLLK